MEEIRLKRSGKRPIVFTGEELYNFSDRTTDAERWTVVRVFRLRGGGFMVGIAKMTNYLDERDSYETQKVETLERAYQYIGEKEPGLPELMTQTTPKSVNPKEKETKNSEQKS